MCNPQNNAYGVNITAFPHFLDKETKLRELSDTSGVTWFIREQKQHYPVI